jgi:hypothetical protein
MCREADIKQCVQWDKILVQSWQHDARKECSGMQCNRSGQKQAETMSAPKHDKCYSTFEIKLMPSSAILLWHVYQGCHTLEMLLIIY